LHRRRVELARVIKPTRQWVLKTLRVMMGIACCPHRATERGKHLYWRGELPLGEAPSYARRMGTLYYGDNLDFLRWYLKDETVDLVYLYPPFNSAKNYNAFVHEGRGINL
jgi:hypothetical protein